MSTTTSGKNGAIGVAVAGLLMAAGGGLHPRVDTTVSFDDGLAGMFESSLWTLSHGLTMAGYVALAVALSLLLRGVGASWSPGLRLAGWVAVAGAAVAAVESLPHVLAASEADALRAGEGATLAELHKALQAVSSPVFGLSIATLALVGAHTGALDGGRIATALACVGGCAFAVAGPAILITEDSALSPLFAGSAGLAIWALVAGVRTARAERAPAVAVAGSAG